MLNTPIAVLVVLSIVVAVNSFLIVYRYVPNTTRSAAPISSPAPTSATATPTATGSP